MRRIFIVLMCFLFFSTCSKKNEENNNNNGNNNNNNINVISSPCKSHFVITTNREEDCIEYSFANGTLHIKHINAGFNCCPDKFSIDLKRINDSILVSEKEEMAQCNCNCLYDLDYDIKGINPGDYILRINEPYVMPDDSQLIIQLHLITSPSGRFCVIRDGYPWKI